MAKTTTETPEQTPQANTDLAAALMLMVEKMQPAQGITADQLAQILEGNAKATRKALRPENERHPDVSAFNPLGERDHPRPKLLRKVIFCGMELHEDELTLAEIELFNKFTHSCVARNGAWKADVVNNAKSGAGELLISIPVATTDDRMELPNGMTLILSELLGGEKAVDPASLASRVAELEKLLKDQSAA